MLKKIRKLVSNWSQLSNLGQSPTIKTSYVWFFAVPVLMKLISRMDSNLNFVILNQEIPLTLELPFSLKCLFYSSVCFSVANLIYTYYCPNFIKNYKTYTDYKTDGKTSTQLISEFKQWVLPKDISVLGFSLIKPEDLPDYTDKNHGSSYITAHSFITNYIPVDTSDKRYHPFKVLEQVNSLEDKHKNYFSLFDPPDKEITKPFTSTIEANAFEDIRNYIDNLKFLIRSICAAFYLIGFLILGYLAFQNIWYVISN